MAKSMRSKRKRKMRAIKRNKLDVKLTEKMKIKSNMIKDQEVASLVNLTTTLDENNGQCKDNNETAVTVVNVEMDDTTKCKKVYNKKTLRDEHGQYPVWMNKRKIVKNKLKNKKIKRIKRLKS
ncbi:hypothetical protein HELRODRAFT_170361 [Helobdella robusta]|uniref:Protein LLP homolog n=1 Tax=Helobdella robusta TaxID=6412 RepID=T1F2Z0_HELRO|nr:hypothetical protein HELRODRAFT_170361 [Helobdella robusta]ESO07806.1 hypothetical protein HELRODRAFT_170361 [Helobdella robusta]